MDISSVKAFFNGLFKFTTLQTQVSFVSVDRMGSP